MIAFDIPCSEPPMVRVGGRRAVQTPSSGGFSSGRQIADVEVRVWKLTWKSFGRELTNRLRAKYAETSASVLPMSFVTPDESTVTVQFSTPYMRTVRSGPRAGSIEIELVEVP